MEIFPQTLMKSLRRKTILTALCYIVLGIFFIVKNDIAHGTLLKAVSIFVFAAGLVSMIGYFTGQDTFSGGLASGLLLAVMGGAIFIETDRFILLLFLLLAVAILYDGAAKLQIAFDLLRADVPGRWILPMILAAFNLILGIVILFNPFGADAMLILIVGIFMVLCGVSDLATCIFCTRSAKYEDNQNENEGDVV